MSTEDWVRIPCLPSSPWLFFLFLLFNFFLRASSLYLPLLATYLTLLNIHYIFLVSSPFPPSCICMFHICTSYDCIYFGTACTLHIPAIIYSRSCLANLIPILKCLLSPRLLDCCGLLDKWLHCPEEY
jgi:hypothetical protein